MKRSIIAAAAALALIAGGSAMGSSAAAAADNITLAPASEPASNPLKGFIPFAPDSSSFPHSMEWKYIAVRDVVTSSDPSQWNWGYIDNVLDDIASRGHQSAIRFYLDYPDSPTGVPQYLIDAGLEMRPYSSADIGTGKAPNYDDEGLLSMLDTFIGGLSRFDGNPKIGFLQAGIVGFWGEWHTYGFNYMPKPENQARIVRDFDNAINTTQLEIRYPTAQNASAGMGYHDDSFPYDTESTGDVNGWHFMDQMAKAGTTSKWQTQGIGGELYPPMRACIFTASGCGSSLPGDFANAKNQSHASWMMYDYAFKTGFSGGDYTRALAAHTSLGYSFQAKTATVPSSTSGSATVGMSIANVGVAPFYYNWNVSLALVDGSGNKVREFATDWNVRTIAVGSTPSFSKTIDLSGLGSGSYRLVAQVPNQMSGGQPIRFANAAQDSVLSGWLTLGTMSVN